MFTTEESLETMMLDETLSVVTGEKGGPFGNTNTTTTTLSMLSRVLSPKDANAVPYLVLFFASAVVMLFLLVINTFICLLEHQRKGRSHGIHLKHLHLKDSNNKEFVVISGKKPKHQEGGYIPLNAKVPNYLFKQSEIPRRGFTCAKKGILVTYTSFRVFYTFIFTFSVALSILFSFWPPVGVENMGSASIWNKGILLPLRQREAARRESDTEKLMNQHSAKAAQLVHACQDTLIRQIVDVAREVDRTVQEVLDAELNPQKSKENMFKLLEAFILRYMNDLDLAVQDYISHLRAELDSSMMPDVIRFSELLSSIYASQWLLFVKRMMNSTHIPWDINAPEVQFVPTPEHLNALRLKVSNIEFARQFGLAEAENFLFIPSLITSQ
ncbi:unnamed protein product [Hydatigera taeniaeformis]|uniref:Uncharacterized protein n=1 Tax=Hydatigena taeniaeformis TaxID=6205 RepID=A0A0R3WT94_HYDTA|nr:unnamed protein product [Hydatigera taeniaeformis]